MLIVHCMFKSSFQLMLSRSKMRWILDAILTLNMGNKKDDITPHWFGSACMRAILLNSTKLQDSLLNVCSSEKRLLTSLADNYRETLPELPMGTLHAQPPSSFWRQAQRAQSVSDQNYTQQSTEPHRLPPYPADQLKRLPPRQMYSLRSKP
jgi:hypothetical protein